jgi:hypothetical protein
MAACSSALASRPISLGAVSTAPVSALASWAVSPAAEAMLALTGAGESRPARRRELRLGSADTDAALVLVLEREALH